MGSPWEIFQKENLSCYERNRFFMNARGRTYLDASFVSGADHDGDSRAAMALDFNHDGKLDLLVRQAGGGPLLAYENRFATGNAVNVWLRGRKSHRSGIGARLVGRVGDQKIVRECYPHNCFRSQAALVQSFGLGSAEQLDELVIRWPSGIEQTVRNLPAGAMVVATEGQEEFEVAKPGETVAP